MSIRIFSPLGFSVPDRELSYQKTRLFWVSCEEVFTTETQRGEAATKGKKRFHRRDTKFAEFGISNQELFTPRPPRLRGESSFGPIQSTPPLDNLREPRKLSTDAGFIRFSPRPLRLGGAISDPCFTEKPEDPKAQRERLVRLARTGDNCDVQAPSDFRREEKVLGLQK